jgi:hypothetical protein
MPSCGGVQGWRSQGRYRRTPWPNGACNRESVAGARASEGNRANDAQSTQCNKVLSRILLVILLRLEGVVVENKWVRWPVKLSSRLPVDVARRPTRGATPDSPRHSDRPSVNEFETQSSIWSGGTRTTRPSLHSAIGFPARLWSRMAS